MCSTKVTREIHVKMADMTARKLTAKFAIAWLMMAFSFACLGQKKTAGAAPQPSEDISGMYSFLREGEFVQITVEPGAMPAPGAPAPAPGAGDSQGKKRVKLQTEDAKEKPANAKGDPGIPVSGFI